MMYELKDIESRAANAENLKGERSMGGLAGGGRKGAPCIWPVKAGQTATLLDIEGCGTVRHIWLTFPPSCREHLRYMVLRMYWDGQEQPSVECPVGDFFGIAHARFRPMVSEMVSYIGGRGLNCWIPMPFTKSAKITIENDSDVDLPMLFYQVNYTLGDSHPEQMGFFHAQFRRSNCQQMGTDYVILDGVEGKGRYLGTVLGVRNACQELGWWGEGEVKMYFDGETQPTICGTGAEDYIGCAWELEEVCAPQQGCPMNDKEKGLVSMYRWHSLDPIYFRKSLKVTIQQIGCLPIPKARAVLGDRLVHYPAAGAPADSDLCYFDRSDDYSSVAYWYQTLPTKPFPPLPCREERVKDLMLDPLPSRRPE